MEKYSSIFRPHRMACGVVLKNRIAYSNGQQTSVAGATKEPNEAMIVDVATFARSGACLMNVGHCGSMGGGAAARPGFELDKKKIRAQGYRLVGDTRDPGPDSAPQFDYTDGKTWNLVGQMAQAAHLYDTRILVKLGAAFPNGKTLNGVTEPEEGLLFPTPKDDIRFVKPDPVPNNPLAMFLSMNDGKPVPTMEELKSRMATKEEIEETIEDVVDMCLRYKNAGFDGISLRGDRWGVNASTNIRDDEYGGEIEGRGRFQYELYKKIKEECGEKFLVEVVMPGSSEHGHDGQLPHGYTEEEFIRFIMMCEPYIDLVEIREENGMGYQCVGYNSELHVHPTLEYAKHLRNAGFKKTIAVNGGYNDPDEMEEIIKAGVVDLVSTARTFRAEPNFLPKLRTQGKEVPTPCLRCNKCHGSWDRVCVCAVNPKDALQHRLPLIVKEPEKSKKVAVIGGGLIGMRAACFAAERGHQVTIFEKDNKLGGKAAYYAPIYPGLWPVERYMKWLIDELSRKNIYDIRLNTCPKPEELTAEGFEAVIACTGSREVIPPIEGADAAGIWKDEDVYYGNVVPGNKVVIVGGGDVATNTAMYLASIGKDVSVLTRHEMLMRNQFYVHGPNMSNPVVIPELGYGGDLPCYTKYDNLKPIYKATTIKITPTSVTYVKGGEEYTIDADTVIVSGGYKPCWEDAMSYADSTLEFYMAGDDRTDCFDLVLGNRSAYSSAILL